MRQPGRSYVLWTVSAERDGDGDPVQIFRIDIWATFTRGSSRVREFRTYGSGEMGSQRLYRTMEVVGNFIYS